MAEEEGKVYEGGGKETREGTYVVRKENVKKTREMRNNMRKKKRQKKVSEGKQGGGGKERPARELIKEVVV